jgi:hypothetical protein
MTCDARAPSEQTVRRHVDDDLVGDAIVDQVMEEQGIEVVREAGLPFGVIFVPARAGMPPSAVGA